MSNDCSQIADNLARVQARIAAAAIRSGRTSADVTLVAVTKYVDIDAAKAMIDAGSLDLGESRPQELWRKAEAIAHKDLHWHFIGHLQRNKVRRTLPHIALLHACDSVRRLAEVDRVSGELGLEMKTLLEVNISGDESKHGFKPEEMASVIEALGQYEHVSVTGLMGMASLTGDTDSARRDFERLRQLRDSLQSQTPNGISLDELSMGMSRDFEQAIEEGATIVRVGSTLFEDIER